MINSIARVILEILIIGCIFSLINAAHEADRKMAEYAREEHKRYRIRIDEDGGVVTYTLMKRNGQEIGTCEAIEKMLEGENE